MSAPRRACTLAELDAAGGIVPVEHAGREAIVVRSRRGEVFALDRYCPHEGYALDDADVAGETITCPWHGWCFDLRSGTCLTAGEDTRSYRVELRGEEVWVELDVDASDAERARIGEVLLSAVEAGDPARAARNAVRLLDAGAAPADAVLLLARYGATHGPVLGPATGVLADVLGLAAVEPSLAPLLVAEGAALVAEQDGRRPPRLPAEPASSFAYDAGAGPGAALTALAAARDPLGAEALVLGLLDRGTPPAELVELLAGAAATAFRGPWPLALVERAGRLAALDPELARVVLSAAARTVADAPTLEGVAPYRDRPAVTDERVDGLADDLGASLLAYDVAHEEETAGDASLLAVGEAVVHLHAAAAMGDAQALVQASWLADDARAWRRPGDAPAGDAPPAPELVRLAAVAAASAPGEVVCLAAARAALELDRPALAAGVAHLLVTPRRERFIDRVVAAEQRRLAPGG